MAKPSIPRKIAENELLKIIKKNQPISIYKLKITLGYASYSGIYDYIMELEEKGKIRTELRIGENNRTERIVFVKEQENEK